MKKELVALEPELKKKSEDTNNLMEKLVVDQEEADKVWQFTVSESNALWVIFSKAYTKTLFGFKRDKQ